MKNFHFYCCPLPPRSTPNPPPPPPPALAMGMGRLRLSPLPRKSRAIRSSRGRAAEAATRSASANAHHVVPEAPISKTAAPGPPPHVRYGASVAKHHGPAPSTSSQVIASSSTISPPWPLPSLSALQQSSHSAARPRGPRRCRAAHGGRLRQVRRRGNERLPTTLNTLSCSPNHFAPPPPLTDLADFTSSQVLEAFGVDRTKGLSDSQVLISSASPCEF
jgi:hypothetical protein